MRSGRRLASWAPPPSRAGGHRRAGRQLLEHRPDEHVPGVATLGNGGQHQAGNGGPVRPGGPWPSAPRHPPRHGSRPPGPPSRTPPCLRGGRGTGPAPVALRLDQRQRGETPGQSQQRRNPTGLPEGERRPRVANRNGAGAVIVSTARPRARGRTACGGPRQGARPAACPAASLRATVGWWSSLATIEAVTASTWSHCSSVRSERLERWRSSSDRRAASTRERRADTMGAASRARGATRYRSSSSVTIARPRPPRPGDRTRRRRPRPAASPCPPDRVRRARTRSVRRCEAPRGRPRGAQGNRRVPARVSSSSARSMIGWEVSNRAEDHVRAGQQGNRGRSRVRVSDHRGDRGRAATPPGGPGPFRRDRLATTRLLDAVPRRGLGPRPPPISPAPNHCDPGAVEAAGAAIRLPGRRHRGRGR